MLCCSAMFRLLMNLDTKTATTTTHAAPCSSIQCFSIFSDLLASSSSFSPSVLFFFRHSTFIAKNFWPDLVGAWHIIYYALRLFTSDAALRSPPQSLPRPVQSCGARRRVCGGLCSFAEPAATSGFSFPRGLIYPKQHGERAKQLTPRDGACSK